MTSSPAVARDGPRRRRWSVAALTLGLVTVLLAVNALAIAGIVNARASAREAARTDLELQTQVHARTFEALLANLRADLLFLSQSAPVSQLPGGRDLEDPMVRRWLRLDGEGTLLLFLSAHPAIDRLVVRGESGDPLIVVGLLDGVPQVLTAGSGPAGEWPTRGAGPLLHGAWPIGGTTSSEGARLEAQIDGSRLLPVAAPGIEGRLELTTAPPTEPPAEGFDTLWVRAPIVDDQWSPPVDWWLVREERGGQWMQSLEALSDRYRTTLAFNLAVILLTLGLGLLAYRQVRRAARLEAVNEQQAEIRELERRLMHSERLASVGRLAAGIAHEINNPLEGMANFLRVLEDDLAEGDAEAAARWTPKLRHGLERSAGVIRQVLTFSDPARAPKERVVLDHVLRETVDFVAANPEFGSLTLETHLPEGEVVVLANRTTLGQLFLNLLLNAAEALLEGGGPPSEPIRIDLEAVGDGGARVSVSDRGPGFDEETLEHLFEPFYSGHGSSGLGLAVCYGIVQDLGGRITASNRDGGGARVLVELPPPPGLPTDPPSPP